MTWHISPKDDAWKRVTLEIIAAQGQRVWLRCNECSHERYVSPLPFANERGLDPATPLLSVARRLVCSVCGERRSHCWPEPYRGNAR